MAAANARRDRPQTDRPQTDRPQTDRPVAKAVRPDPAEVLAASLTGDGLTDLERHAAEAELRGRLPGAALALRRAVADRLKSSPRAPLDILMALVGDQESVAIPILEHSPVLADADLARLAATATTARRTAMARRPSIGKALAEALVESAEAAVVATLLANRAAGCSEPLMMACLDRCPASEAVHKALINRPRLPVAVALRLVTLASDELSQLLTARHPVPAVPDTETVELTRNRPRWWSQQMSGYFS